MPQKLTSDRHIESHLAKALNKIRKPSTVEEVTDLLNKDLGPGDQFFGVEEVAESLRNASGTTLTLYWSKGRPRR